MSQSTARLGPAMEDGNQKVECAIAIVWPEGFREPVCEMFRVDHEKQTWTSKHYSSGTTFNDGGKLHDGETARTLAESGTRSGIHRFAARTTVTFVVADLEPAQFESTRPTDWTLAQLSSLPGADVSIHGPH